MCTHSDVMHGCGPKRGWCMVGERAVMINEGLIALITHILVTLNTGERLLHVCPKH